jgi:hypothetical protein
LVTHSIAGKIAQPRTSPSSRGLGHRPFTAVTRVRIPLGARSTAVKVIQIQMQGFESDIRATYVYCFT